MVTPATTHTIRGELIANRADRLWHEHQTQIKQQQQLQQQQQQQKQQKQREQAQKEQQRQDEQIRADNFQPKYIIKPNDTLESISR